MPNSACQWVREGPYNLDERFLRSFGVRELSYFASDSRWTAVRLGNVGLNGTVGSVNQGGRRPRTLLVSAANRPIRATRSHRTVFAMPLSPLARKLPHTLFRILTRLQNLATRAAPLPVANQQAYRQRWGGQAPQAIGVIWVAIGSTFRVSVHTSS